MKYIRWFQDISMADIPSVGGKNASLGQMIQNLSSHGITVPNGFAVTADAYRYYLESNKLPDTIQGLLTGLQGDDTKQLRENAGRIRTAIEAGSIPPDLRDELIKAYETLSAQYHVTDCDVAVRSSATAEDLPTASFAGQQETFLNVRGADAVCRAYQQGLASLFTDRAIVYRIRQGFDHFDVALSVGVQKMIRSDLASSGVAFSLDPETGFAEVVVINGSYGLGESIVKGLVTPDEFVVYKPTLLAGYTPIIKKRLGDKKTALVYGTTTDAATVTRVVSPTEYTSWCLSDDEVLALARMVCTIEKHYSANAHKSVPMDIEWAKDGVDGKLYIIQARPETVHAAADNKRLTITQYQLTSSQAPNTLLTGQSIGQRIVSGTVRIIKSVSEIDQIQAGDILVTQMTDPDWVPAMKRVAGIVTELGGRTCHAAIVSRELHVPALVGAAGATTLLHDGQQITLDCSQGLNGFIYDGAVAFEEHTQFLDELPTISTPMMVNVADPDRVFSISKLPVAGVGLARIEFIIAGTIKIHPCALLYPEKVDQKTAQQIADMTQGYVKKSDYFVELLSQGVGMIAAAFYPRPVIVRFSDFKTNEYRNLIGGTFFEPHEENPMLGLRGASRYYHPDYQQAFALECEALARVRTQMGLDNVKLMVPFVRTVNEARIVTELLATYGLVAGQNKLQIMMMCELPANVLCIDQFSNYFDGFSIGSNDLAQTTLGVDRDSAFLATAFDERDEAVKRMMALAISGARAAGKSIGICGQAPSDYPEIADFLIEKGISSLSLNPDSVIPFLLRYKK